MMLFEKWNDVTGGWRGPHNKELHKLYSSSSIITIKVKEDKMGRACNTNGEGRNAYRMLVGKSAQRFS
jgi:hypothetical protein